MTRAQHGPLIALSIVVALLLPFTFSSALDKKNPLLGGSGEFVWKPVGDANPCYQDENLAA